MQRAPSGIFLTGVFNFPREFANSGLGAERKQRFPGPTAAKAQWVRDPSPWAPSLTLSPTDNRVWMPLLLQGKKFNARFLFDGDQMLGCDVDLLA